jgi:hypothetical protein
MVEEGESPVIVGVEFVDPQQPGDFIQGVLVQGKYGPGNGKVDSWFKETASGCDSIREKQLGWSSGR